MANLNLDETLAPAAIDTIGGEVRPDVLPDILLIPGLNNSGPGHWQTVWERMLPRAHRVDLGLWDDPHRNTWVNKLALAIGRADKPVVLVAHSLGCHVVSWWAEYEAAFTRHLRNAEPCPVLGALLVAPPDVDERPADRRLTRFAPMPASPLPFPSIVVGSRDDPYLSIGQGRRIAHRWGSRFVDGGAIGHVNARSGLGEWTFGLDLLRQLSPASVPAHAAGFAPIAASEGPALMRWE